MHTFTLFGVEICSADKSELLSLLLRNIKHERQNAVFTPNTQMLLAANDNDEIKKLLNSSSVNIPDGAGVRLAARLRGKKLERISGIDIAEDLMEISSKEELSIFFLGGNPTVAERAAQNMKKKYPSLRICGTQHGYFDKSGNENNQIIKKICRASPDILFVCFGFPVQERWISENLARLPSVKLAIGLGGRLDVWAGDIKRAPRPIQRLCFEWLWRTIREPRRARIFIDIPRFLIKALTDK